MTNDHLRMPPLCYSERHLIRELETTLKWWNHWRKRRTTRNSLFRGATPYHPGEVATAAGVEDQHSGSPASTKEKDTMTIVGIKNSINVLNHIISTCKSTKVPENTKSLKWLSETSQKVTEITPHHKGYSMLKIPIVHLSWNRETPQVTELTRRKIMPLAATPNLCNIFAGRISRFL